MGNTMHRPGQRDLGDRLGPECQPFFTQAKDQHADRFALRQELFTLSLGSLATQTDAR